jgi:hypothetical protein
MDGGALEKIIDGNSGVATWSPDGNFLVVTSWNNAPNAARDNVYLQVFDLRTKKLSVVPSSYGIFGAQWITQDRLVAANSDAPKFSTFDFKSQKWSELIAGDFVSWNLSLDRKYIYFTTGGAEPKAQRLRFGDRQAVTIADLKDLHMVDDSVEGIQINVAPDGSPVFTRDIGSQEIYALTVRWP